MTKTVSIRRCSNSKDFEMMLTLQSDLFKQLRNLDSENHQLRLIVDAMHRAASSQSGRNVKLSPACKGEVEALNNRGWTVSVQRTGKTFSVLAVKVADGDSHTIHVHDDDCWDAL